MRGSQIRWIGLMGLLLSLVVVPAAAHGQPPAEARASNPGGLRVTQLQLSDVATPTRSGMKATGSIRIEGQNVQVWRARADLTVDGRLVARDIVLGINSSTVGADGVSYSRAYGAGLVRLTNLRVTGYDDNAKQRFTDLLLPVPAHSFRARYAPDPYKTRVSNAKRVERKPGRVVVRVASVYRDRREKLRSVDRVIVQRKVGRKSWRKVRAVKLKRNGKGRLVVRAGKKKQRFRVVVKKSKTFAPFRSKPSKRV